MIKVRLKALFTASPPLTHKEKMSWTRGVCQVFVCHVGAYEYKSTIHNACTIDRNDHNNNCHDSQVTTAGYNQVRRCAWDVPSQSRQNLTGSRQISSSLGLLLGIDQFETTIIQTHNFTDKLIQALF